MMTVCNMIVLLFYYYYLTLLLTIKTVPSTFELLYRVFTQQFPLHDGKLTLYAPERRELGVEDVVDFIQTTIEEHTKKYRNLSQQEEDIDFSNPLARFAYMYMYVPVHIRLVYLALELWDKGSDGEVIRLFR